MSVKPRQLQRDTQLCSHTACSTPPHHATHESLINTRVGTRTTHTDRSSTQTSPEQRCPRLPRRARNRRSLHGSVLTTPNCWWPKRHSRTPTPGDPPRVAERASRTRGSGYAGEAPRVRAKGLMRTPRRWDVRVVGRAVACHRLTRRPPRHVGPCVPIGRPECRAPVRWDHPLRQCDGTGSVSALLWARARRAAGWMRAGADISDDKHASERAPR
jgi:hypothetical protein